MVESDISAWPEYHDLWNSLLGPDIHEDEKILTEALSSLAHSHPPGRPITVISLGPSSTRIVNHLHPTMQTLTPHKFTIHAIQQPAPAQHRAQPHCTSPPLPAPNITVHWSHADLTSFTTTTTAIPQTQTQTQTQPAHLVVAAQGIYHRLLTDRDIKLFLAQVRRSLDPTRGRFVVSFLHEFMPETDHNEFTAFGSVEHGVGTGTWGERVQTMRRAAGGDGCGGWWLVEETGDGAEYGEVRTMRFEVGGEGVEGAEKHEVRWDMRVLDGLALLDHLREAGLQLDRIVDGKVQEIWFVKVRRGEML